MYSAAQACLTLLHAPTSIYLDEDTNGGEVDMVEVQPTSRCRMRFAMGSPKGMVLLGVLAHCALAF